MSDARLLEFVARLTYDIDGLSGKLRLYFSQFLTFHFSKSISVNQIENIENKRAAMRFASDDELRSATATFTTTEKCWAVAAIYFLQAEAERQDDRALSRRLRALAEDVIRILSLEGENSLIESERSVIDAEFRSFNERPVVRIPARIWPMFLDFFVRCSLLLYFGLNDLNKSLLTGLNVLVVTGGMLLAIIVYSRRDRRHNRRLLEAYGGKEKYRIEYRVTSSQYTWLALFLGLSTFISYLLPDQLHAIAFLGLGLYYFVYIRFFCLGRISENDLVRQLEQEVQHTDRLDVDENDEMIVNLETQLLASTSRLDAYVLESALFGALSFSGFLQIMASDLISFTDLENFATNIFTASQALIHLQWEGFEQGLSLLNNKVSLFCLVSVESLVCSIFFLAVIASRLRFSDIADKVRTSLNLARAFNEKEEVVYHESEKSDVRQSRLQALTQRVNRQLFDANQSLIKVEPIVAYMEYFRNAGILAFLVILISSSLFITSVLGWIFLALIAATYLYFNREFVNIKMKAGVLELRVTFLRRSYWFLAVAVSPFVIDLILRNSFIIGDSPLIPLGYLLVGAYFFVSLMLASHYDEDFGEIEQKQAGRPGGRWGIVKNTVAAMILLYFVALAFKHLRLAGADEMAAISLSMVSVSMYFTGYYLSKVKWFGLVSGALLGTASVGILFKNLHLTGANEMLLTGMIGIIICTVIVWLNGNNFHSLLLRFCLVFLFATSTMVTGIFARLELAYAHRTMNLAPIMRVIDAHNGDFLPGEQVPPLIPANYFVAAEAISAAEWYISTYGNTVRYSTVYERLAHTYNHFAGGILWLTSRGELNPLLLEDGLLMVRERDRILALFDFPRHAVQVLDMDLESDLLLALDRKEEAIASLNRMLKELEYPEQQEYLSTKLAAITGEIDQAGN